MPDVLTTAVERHRTGQVEQAAQLYQRVLACEPDNVQALHSYGVLCHQRGEHDSAVELLCRALALRPNAIESHVDLAEAYRALTQFERAIGCCRVALALAPDHPGASCNLGAALQGSGRHAEAAEHFRRALELQPDFAIAHNNLGIALHQLGQPDEALEHFRRAVELQPTFVSALANLGQALLDRGLAEEALGHCREAVRLQPDTALLHQNLGNVLQALDRVVEARAAYLESLRLAPDLALSYVQVGLSLHGEGKVSDALPWIKKASELQPANATLLERLAELYDELEEPGESIPCWRRLLALGEDVAGPHIGLGRALLEEGLELAEAREHLQIALKLQPDAAVALMVLAKLQEQLGEMAEAEASLRAALHAQPNVAVPHGRLAALLRGKLPAEDVLALERHLADEQLGKGPRARLLFGLAHVLDARGDFARAADCLHEANAIALELNRASRGYVPEEHSRFVDGYVEHFNHDVFGRLKEAGSDSRRPVFVFGLPRSGTTLIEQVLASHSRIHGAGELQLARKSFDALPRVLKRSAPPRDCLPFLDVPAVQQIAQQHLDRLAILDRGDYARIVDKMPDNYLYLGLLAILFPRAVLIHCCRDLRDIAVSCWMTDFGNIRWANDPQHIATRFQQYRRIMDHWRAVLPIPIVEVDYEETVADLEGVSRRLIAACDLEWEPACLEFYLTERPIRTASLTQVRQPLYQRSVGRWQNYQAALTELFTQLPLTP